MLQPYLVSADVPCLTPLLLCLHCWRCPEVTTGLRAEFCYGSHARHSIMCIHISPLHPLLDCKLSEDRHCVSLTFVPWLPSSVPGTQHMLNNKLDILPTMKKKSSPFWSVISFFFRWAGDVLISIALLVSPVMLTLITGSPIAPTKPWPCLGFLSRNERDQRDVCFWSWFYLTALLPRGLIVCRCQRKWVQRSNVWCKVAIVNNTMLNARKLLRDKFQVLLPHTQWYVRTWYIDWLDCSNHFTVHMYIET